MVFLSSVLYEYFLLKNSVRQKIWQTTGFQWIQSKPKISICLTAISIFFQHDRIIFLWLMWRSQIKTNHKLQTNHVLILNTLGPKAIIDILIKCLKTLGFFCKIQDKMCAEIPTKIPTNTPQVIHALIFCVEFRELSHLIHDLSQAEKKIIVVTSNSMAAANLKKVRTAASKYIPYFHE